MCRPTACRTGEIRSLIRVYRDLASDPDLPGVFVEWYSLLSLELREVLIGRENRWLDITAGAARGRRIGGPLSRH